MSRAKAVMENAYERLKGRLHCLIKRMRLLFLTFLQLLYYVGLLISYAKYTEMPLMATVYKMIHKLNNKLLY